MKSHRFFPNLLVVIMTVGLVSATTELAAGPLKVVSANPNSGYTGETHTVTIKGTGFLKAKNVRFLVTQTDLTGGVSVELVKVVDDATITAKVIIPLGATVSDYDIEVQLVSGRKGKGTTLFKVESKDGSTGNDNHVGRGMICTLNEDEDLYATVMDDGDADADAGPVYEGGVDEVLCLSGDVVGDNLSPLRFSNLPGGNPKQIKFAKRFLDLAFGDCTPLDVDGLGCTNLPPELTQAGTPDTAYLQVTPYAEQNHIHLMEPSPSEPIDTYGMAMRIDPRDFEQRYSIQMSSRNPGKRQSSLCYFDAEGYETTNDINVFVWKDGTYSGVSDGLPDGYTVTTGQILSAESEDTPPSVSPGYAEALICSNIGPGPNFEHCPDRKNRDGLCFVLGVVQIRFTLQMEYQQ